MASDRSIERDFFRTLNRVVEPMVRAGLGSPRIVPGGCRAKADFEAQGVATTPLKRQLWRAEFIADDTLVRAHRLLELAIVHSTPHQVHHGFRIPVQQRR